MNIVYYRDKCGHCTKAKDLLTEKGIAFTPIKITEIDDWQEIKERLQSENNVEITTVPQIILEGKYIGGHQELIKHFEYEFNTEEDF